MNLVIDLLLAVYVVVSLLLVLVVLMQRPRSEGLGTAFASGMVEQFIGPATSFLVRFTTWMGGAFFILSIILAVLYSHLANTHSKIGDRLRSVPALKAAARPSPAASLAPPMTLAPAAPAGTPIMAGSPAAVVGPSTSPSAVAPTTAATTPGEIPVAPPPLTAPPSSPAASPAR